jgi:hypothetical protein
VLYEAGFKHVRTPSVERPAYGQPVSRSEPIAATPRGLGFCAGGFDCVQAVN